MSIEDTIKRAFKKDKKLREVVKWSPDRHPNIYELDKYLRKSGYRLVDLVPHNNKDIPEVLLEPMNPGYLYPEISHFIDENKFYVNVIKYGMLESSDVEGIIQGYENALAIVKYLESLDLRKLEVSKST